MTAAVLLVLLSQADPPSLGSKPGDLDGGQPFDSARTRCVQCHDRSISDPGDPLYLPFDGWVSTMMANSVRDPLFQAAVSVANQDVPGVGSWCLRCHAPQSYMRGHNVPPDGGAFDALDTEGVTCDVCHRSVAAPDSGFPVIGNAQIYFERSNVKYGPYENVSSPAHAGTDGGITAGSELCGQCHQVENPLVPWRNPVDGGELGPRFPLDTTYDEWKQSKYAATATLQTCQSCHMPETSNDAGVTQWIVAKFAGVVRDSPRRHVFAGGNVWGLDAVQANDPATMAAYADQFAETRRFALENLHKAAELTVEVPGNVAPGGSAAIHVHIKNKTGHKLPTGYADGRRIVIQMTLDGYVHTGGFDGGQLVDDGWLRTYEVRHGRFGVGAEDHLAQHDLIIVDTRIPPTGFTPPNGAATVPVPQELYANGDGTYADFDDITWDVDVPTTKKVGETFDVMVRLMYQSTTPEYVDFLHTQNTTTDRGQNLANIYHATGDAEPIEMVRVEKQIPVQVGGAGGGGGGGGLGRAGGQGSTGGGAEATGGGAGHMTGVCECSAPGPGLLVFLAVAFLRRRRR